MRCFFVVAGHAAIWAMEDIPRERESDAPSLTRKSELTAASHQASITSRFRRVRSLMISAMWRARSTPVCPCVASLGTELRTSLAFSPNGCVVPLGFPLAATAVVPLLPSIVPLPPMPRSCYVALTSAVATVLSLPARLPRQSPFAFPAQPDFDQRLFPLARFLVDKRQLERPQRRHLLSPRSSTSGVVGISESDSWGVGAGRSVVVFASKGSAGVFAETIDDFFSCPPAQREAT